LDSEVDQGDPADIVEEFDPRRIVVPERMFRFTIPD
jgi:hypothetical protein